MKHEQVLFNKYRTSPNRSHTRPPANSIPTIHRKGIGQIEDLAFMSNWRLLSQRSIIMTAPSAPVSALQWFKIKNHFLQPKSFLMSELTQLIELQNINMRIISTRTRAAINEIAIHIWFVQRVMHHPSIIL